MKKVSWKIVGILALVLSTVALTMMFGGLGTTMSRLALTGIAALAIIATVMLMPKQETPAAPAASETPAAPAASETPVASTASETSVATPAAPEAPVAEPAAAPATHNDILNCINVLSGYYEGQSASIANESNYLDDTNQLADLLIRTSELYVQSKEKRNKAEQRAEQLNAQLNIGSGSNNQNL